MNMTGGEDVSPTKKYRYFSRGTNFGDPLPQHREAVEQNRNVVKV